MKKIILLFFAVCTLFSKPGFCTDLCLSDHYTERSPTNFIRLMNQHREYLADRIFTFVELKLNPSYENIRIRWLELRKPLDENATKEKRKHYLQTLLYAGSYFSRYDRTIDDDTVIGILAVALFDPDEGIRKSSYMTLGGVSDKKKAPYAGLIKDAICRFSFADEAKMLASLPLTDEEKRKLFTQDQRYIIRAKQGDKTSEKGLIEGFESADDFRKKKDMADALAYVGSEACGRALAGALNSDMFYKDERYHISIRYHIIEALGRIRPEQRLLSFELSKVYFRNEPYDTPEGIKEYLEKVYRWAEETYGVSLGEVEDSPVLYISTPAP